MHRALSSRRGASEIIAVMLLIVITVAASILMYVYASGLMGGLQGAVRQPYLEQVALEYYDWSGTSTCSTSLAVLCLTVRNAGATVVNFQSADYFVNGASVTATVSITSSTATTTVSPQNSARITLTGLSSLGITPGIAYTIKIATKNGAIFSFSCIAGKATGSY